MARSKKTKSKSVAGSGWSLNPPKKTTYWASLIIAAVGMLAWVLYAWRPVQFPGLEVVGFLFVAAAFVLLAVSLRVKGL